MSSYLEFPRFIRLILGVSPFKYQEKLAEHLVNHDYRDMLIADPGLGKTLIVLIWFYALYRDIIAYNENKTPRQTPIRCTLTVPRRVIVDQGYELAKKLWDALEAPTVAELKNSGHSDDEIAKSLGLSKGIVRRLLGIKASPELKEVANTIKNHFGIKRALVVGKMRGGIRRSDKNAWVHSPNQPVIVVSTIQQAGSRLFMQGYDLEPAHRPIHAGLLAVDNLFICDEAGLAASFCLNAKEVFKRVNLEKIGNIPQARLIQMSATITPAEGQTSYEIEEEIRSDVALRKRLSAKRSLHIKKIVDEKLCETLVQEAVALKDYNLPKGKGKPKLISVVVNTVPLADQVYQALPGEKILMTGRIRFYERHCLLKKYKHQIISGWRANQRTEPLFVVSTQVIETGADFDFDGMVFQACPADIAAQRLGRVDRLGELGQTKNVMVWNGLDDPVYGKLSGLFFKYLERLGN